MLHSQSSPMQSSPRRVLLPNPQKELVVRVLLLVNSAHATKILSSLSTRLTKSS